MTNAGVQALDVAAGLGLLAAGWLLARRGRSGSGRLLMIASAAWFTGSLVPELALMHRIPLVAALLWNATRRPQWRRVLALTACCGLAAVATIANGGMSSVVLGVGLLSVALDRNMWTRTTRGAQQACEIYGAVVLIGPALGWLGITSSPATSIGYSTAVLIVMVWITRPRQTTVEHLAIDLSSSSFDGPLVQQLRWALDDPTLELLIGQRTAGTLEPRATTTLTRSGREVAVLRHASDLHLDPSVIEGLGAILGLVSDAANLRSQAERTLAEIDESSRLLAGTREREAAQLAQQVERGPVAHLLNAMTLLDGDAIVGQLEDAVRELRQVAEGLALAGIEASGFTTALGRVAAASPVRVELHLGDVALPPPLAGTLFLVCCEAIANAIKHAGAGVIGVRIGWSNDELVAEIVDDGRGGADPSGAGLRGLAERARTVGGSMTVFSPLGGGTQVRVVVPIAGTTS